ncbi:cancer/testis antigen family 47 member C1-like [Eschrichtius robustus]|uniref:cancer/testis antigen family 47 member C1-like n=1 Tax=Eschrichtius robustus TaxID=9764 RepID=UPI0035C25B7C
MSATEERGPIPGGQAGAGGGAGGDPSPLGVRASPSGGMDGAEGAAALLASLGLSRALHGEDGGQEAAQAAVEEDWDEEEETEEEEEEEETEEEEEEEEQFKLEIEDQEEDEYQSEEGDETEEEVEEEEETEEEDENGHEGAGVVAGHGPPTARFQSLFRDLVHCCVHHSHYNDRVLVGPHTGRVMVRRRSRRPSDPAEDAAPPQEQEDLGEAGEVWRGEYQAEGTQPWEPQEPAEGAASQKAEEPAAEAEFWADDVLADAAESWEAGACGPDDGAEAGEGRTSPQALAAPAGASA